jgi:hypothetical protein
VIRFDTRHATTERAARNGAERRRTKAGGEVLGEGVCVREYGMRFFVIGHRFGKKSSRVNAVDVSMMSATQPSDIEFS